MEIVQPMCELNWVKRMSQGRLEQFVLAVLCGSEFLRDQLSTPGCDVAYNNLAAITNTVFVGHGSLIANLAREFCFLQHWNGPGSQHAW